MSDDLQSKQAYLRENVLETGYDADEFMTFLQTKKGENGLDLNNWSMNELITVVDEFINSKKVKSNPQLEQSEEKEEKNEEENNQEINLEYNNNENINEEKMNNININNMPYNSVDDGDDYIGKCQANEITSFSNIDNIKVKLSSPKKVEGKMFQKAFISYTVNTEPFNFEMNKRYSDFLWLKKMLSLIYVNCVVPPLCKKNFSDRFTDYLIEKRMRSIEKFMDGILEHPLLRNSEIVKDFLSMVNSREYNKKIEKYNKIKKSPAFVRQIKTMSGEVNIGINNEKEIYFDNIKNYVKGHYILLQKITKGYKSIMNIMQQLSNKMKDVSKVWKQVFDISIKYSDSYNTSGTYNIMSKLMEDWSEIQKSQMNVINRDIREYFRYVKNEFNGLKEMTERVQNSKSAYIKFKEKLQKTKEALFEKQDPETWQLKDEDKQNVVNLLKNKELAFSRMLPQDTLKLKEYKQFYGCLLNSLIAEFERIRKINNRRHKENTVKFVRELSAEITNLHVTLADRQCEFHELKDDTEDYNKIGGGFIKQVEKIEENLDEKDNNNNSINNIENNKEIIEDNNIDNLENNNIINNHIENNNINNHVENNNIISNNVSNNFNNDITKDFEKLEHSDFIDNNKKDNTKDKTKNKNKKKDDDKKEKKLKEKKIENKNIDIKEEKKEIIVNNIDKNIKEEKKDIIIDNNIENNIININNIPKEEKKMEKKEILIKKNEDKIENKNPVEIKQEIKEEKINNIEMNPEKKEEIKINAEIKEIKKEENNIDLNNKDNKKENESKLNNIEEKKEEEKKEIKVKEPEKPEENKNIKNEEDKKEENKK